MAVAAGAMWTQMPLVTLRWNSRWRLSLKMLVHGPRRLDPARSRAPVPQVRHPSTASAARKRPKQHDPARLPIVAMRAGAPVR